MSDNTAQFNRAEKADQLMTVGSGWGALVLGVLGMHRWVAQGNMDWWARAGLIMGFGLAVMWAWGCWPVIVARFRAWKQGGGLNTALVAVGLVVCLVMVNTLVRRRLPLKFDLTQNKRFTLAPRSREILNGLKEPVRATVYIPAGRSTQRARDLFRQYADASPNFNWKHVDPLVNLNEVLAKQVKLSTDLQGAVLEYGNKRQDLTEFSEKAVTGAILKMTRDTVRKIYFLEGHGEMPFELAGGGDQRRLLTALSQDLQDTQWKVEKLNLYGKDVKVPDPAEAAVIVIAGPEKELADEEKKRLNEYLEKGGRVFLMLNVDGPSYASFLKPWGIETKNDLVLDQRQEQGLVVIEKAEDHPSVQRIRRLIFAPMRTVTPVSPAPTGITVTELVKTGPFTEIVADFKPGAPVNTANAKPGPATVAVLAEKTIGSGDSAKKAQLAVIGDATFASDLMAAFPVYNQALARGLVNYLGEEDALVSIPPKDENTEQAFLTPDQGRLLTLIHFWDFPLLALILAIVVYLKRR